METTREKVLAILTITYSGVIGAMTLGPQPSDAQTNRWALMVIDLVDRYVVSTFSYSNLESLGNVALFTPLGLLLILILGRRRWWIVVLIGIATTCGIEFTQQFIPGRFPDVRDILANSLGTVIGVVLGLPFARRRPGERRGAEAAVRG